jgi:hypothetical protein
MVWALADGETEPVCVLFPTPKRAERGDRPSESAHYPQGWAREALRRAEHAAHSHGLFAVVERKAERIYLGSSRYRDGVPEVSWHLDPACEYAQGKDRHDSGYVPWTIRDVIAVMLHQAPPPAEHRNHWCRACVYLTAETELPKRGQAEEPAAVMVRDTWGKLQPAKV